MPLGLARLLLACRVRVNARVYIPLVLRVLISAEIAPLRSILLPAIVSRQRLMNYSAIQQHERPKQHHGDTFSTGSHPPCGGE